MVPNPFSYLWQDRTQAKIKAQRNQMGQHNDIFGKFYETNNPEDLPGNALVGPNGRQEDDFSLKGQIANWKLWEAPIPNDANLGTLEALHREQMGLWENSAAHKTCTTLLQDVILKQENLKIKTAMCLGLGSISEKREYPFDDVTGRSMSQLVVFESWLEILASKHDIEHIYFQEPCFNALDREFLESKGYTVLQTPEFEDHMTTETLVYAPAVEQAVIYAAMQAALPAIFYGSTLTWHSHHYPSPIIDWALARKWGPTDLPAPMIEEHKLLRPFLEQRVALSLPDFSAWDWFGGNTPLYYKPDSNAGLRPAKFQFEDHKCYHYGSEVHVWRSRGFLEQKEYRGGMVEKMLRLCIYRCLSVFGVYATYYWPR